MTAARCSMMRMTVVVALAVATVAGCAVNAAAPAETTAGTVGDVGQLPGSFTGASTDSAVDTSAPIESTVVADTDTTDVATVVATTAPTTQPIGAKVFGNRVLMIGDSLTASISERYGGEACDALVPLGWEVEVDAETGRFIDFGARVLDKRLGAGWDAAVLFLGNNYGYDRGVFQLALHSLLLRLYPRPTVLITTSLFRPAQAEVNAAILEEATLFDNITVIDWEAVSRDPLVTGGDNIHLTDTGRARLGFQLAFALGPAPKQPGKCLDTNYRNDSAGSPNGPAGNSTATKTTTKTTTKSSGTATTASATTATTATTAATTTIPTATTKATTPTVTTPPTTPVPTTAPQNTAPSTAASTAPPTSPASTAPPPTTAPATTAPPTTAPPTTAPPAQPTTTSENGP